MAKQKVNIDTGGFGNSSADNIQTVISDFDTAITAASGGAGETEVGAGAGSIQGPVTEDSVGALAPGVHAIAFGEASAANGASDVCMGDGAEATNLGAATNDSRIVLGTGANITENVARGRDTSNAIVIGDGANIDATTGSVAGNAIDNIVIGQGAFMNAVNSAACVIIGKGAFATSAGADRGANSSVIIGPNASVDATGVAGNNNVVIGNNARATNTSNVVIGFDADATQGTSVAIGTGAQATAALSTCVGGASRAVLGGSVAMGYNARANGLEGVAIGSDSAASSTLANADQSIAIGTKAICRDDNATAYTIAIGGNAEVDDGVSTCNGSIAFGAGALVTDAIEAIAIGGVTGGASGAGAEATAAQAIAIGVGTLAAGIGSVALGAGMVTFAADELACYAGVFRLKKEPLDFGASGSGSTLTTTIEVPNGDLLLGVSTKCTETFNATSGNEVENLLIEWDAGNLLDPTELGSVGAIVTQNTDSTEDTYASAAADAAASLTLTIRDSGDLTLNNTDQDAGIVEVWIYYRTGMEIPDA